MSETVLLDYEIESPIERVWHALTDPATLSQWMLFETNDFQPVVGRHFQFRGKAATGWTGIVNCEVLEADAPHRLSYTWVTEGQMGRHQTTVTWTLTESDNGVIRLHLEQSGFNSAAKQEIGGAKYGWTHQLNQLETLLASQDSTNEA
ncbi:SRPBCC domain-containing protein [Sulfobacillus harzensis]|uniref:SRPBCC domain-containing protein n=1 Tax=Sulfobacillus harzensis TaxID=2729629 RepID=A0A7Y0L8E8_9FIRM|nr:SRPBCC domain-containing protein [Sulfobacillus harzensis]